MTNMLSTLMNQLSLEFIVIVNDNLTGFYNIEFSISSGEIGGISSLLFKKNDDFKKWLKNNHMLSMLEVTGSYNKIK